MQRNKTGRRANLYTGARFGDLSWQRKQRSMMTKEANLHFNVCCFSQDSRFDQSFSAARYMCSSCKEWGNDKANPFSSSFGVFVALAAAPQRWLVGKNERRSPKKTAKQANGSQRNVLMSHKHTALKISILLRKSLNSFKKAAPTFPPN